MIPDIFKLNANWSDKHAVFEFEDSPKIDLKRYFQKNEGPKAYSQCGKKSTEFVAEIDAAYADWQTERAQANAGAIQHEAMAQARHDLEAAKKASRQELTAQARLKAAASNKRRRTATAVAAED